MRKAAFIAVATALGLLVRTGSVRAEEVLHDFSGFREFTFLVEGPCPPLGEVYRARVTAGAEGGYLLEMSVLELGNGLPPDEGCPPHLPVGLLDACAKEVPLPIRKLTAGEVAALRAAFGEVRLETEEDPICPSLGVSCRIERFTWDATSASGFLCAPPYLVEPGWRQVLGLLRRLRNGGGDCDRNGVLDALDLEAGASDADRDGIPDRCEDFRRGDSNADGRLDIADPVNTLGLLFLGEGTVACPDAADQNDDGQVDIADPVAALGFLFLGMPAPSPSCGVDLTEDELGCPADLSCA